MSISIKALLCSAVIASFSLVNGAILFVDDDGGVSGTSTWLNTLNGLGVQYDYVSNPVNATPTNDFNQYDLVIWSVTDRAYDNLQPGDVTKLTQYLNNGGNLLYTGGHDVYSESNAQSFIQNYLGLSTYQYNMPTIYNSNASAIGTGAGIFDTRSYGLQTSPGNTVYGGTMMSAFNPGVSTATSLLNITGTNGVNISYNVAAPSIAVVNKTANYTAMTWGFDLNQLNAGDRSGVLKNTLDYFNATSVPEPSSFSLMFMGLFGLLGLGAGSRFRKK